MMRNNGSIPISRQQRRRRRRRCCYKNAKSISILLFTTCLSSSGVVVFAADSSTTTTSMIHRGDGSSSKIILPPPPQQQQLQLQRPRPRPPPPTRKDSVVVTQNPAQQQSTTTSKSKILRPPPPLPNEDKAKSTSKLDDLTTIIPPPPPNQSRNHYTVQHTNKNDDSHRPLLPPPPPLRPTKSKTEKSSHHTINQQEQYQGNVDSSVLSKGDTMMMMRHDVESSSNQKLPPPPRPPPPRKLPPSSTTTTTTIQKEESINSWNLNQPPPTAIGTDIQENNHHHESSDGMIVDTEEEGNSFQSRWNNRIDDEAGSKLSSSSHLPPPPPRRRPPPILQRKQDNEEEDESKRSNLFQVPEMDSTKAKKKFFNDIQYEEEISSSQKKQYYEQVSRRAARDDAFVHNDETDNNNNNNNKDQHHPNSDVMLEELSMMNEGKHRVGLAVAVAVASDDDDDDDELLQSQQRQEAESRKEESKEEIIKDDTMMVLENPPIINVIPTTATTNVVENNNNNNNKHVFKSQQPKLMDPNHDVVPSTTTATAAATTTTTTTTTGTYPAYHPSKDVEEDSASSKEKRLGLIAKVGDDMKEQKQSHTGGRLDDDSEAGSTTNILVQDDQVEDDPKISSTPSETYHQIEGSENAEVDDPLSSTTSPITTAIGDSETDRRAGAMSEKQITGPPPPRFGNEKRLPSKHPKDILPPEQPIEQSMKTASDLEEKISPLEMVSPQNGQIPIHQNSKKSSGATYPNNNDPRYGFRPTGQGAFPTNFQAQQQQHIRPPAQQGMNRPNYQLRNHSTAPQNRQPSRSGGTGASWKMLWNKVEKGLDGLANLEESVTGRAQQFVSSAVGGARLGNRPRSGRSVSSTPPPTSFGSTPRPNIISRKREEAKPAPRTLTPYGKKYEVAAKQEAEKDEVKTQVGGDGSRKVDWNDLMAKKMISANGGASAPDSHSHPSPPNMETRTSTQDLPRPPGQQSPHQQQQHQASITSSMPTSTIGTQQQASVSMSTETTTRPVVRPNPYGQHRQTNPPTKATDSHSRASRIPWDSSVPAKQATQRPRPKPSQLSRPISDDDDKASFLEKLSNSLPRIRLPSPRGLFRRRDAYQYEGMDAWDDDDENDGDKQSGLFGLFRRKPKAEAGPASLSPPTRSSDVEQVAPPLDSIMKRCDEGKSSSLLSDIDRREARSIGRYLATSDGIASMFFLLALQQVPNLGAAIPKSINDIFSTTFTKVASSLVESLETYAPFLFVSAYLTMISANILYQPRLAELESSVATNVKSESQYAQLYLRLSTALPVDPRLPMRMRDAAVSQVVSVMSTARLRAYVTFALALLAIMTSSVIGQVFALMGDGLWQLVALSQWRSWPIEWRALGASLIGVVRSVYLSSEALIAKSLTQFLDNPLHFAFHLSIAVSLLLTAFLPTLEEKRRSKPLADDEDDFALSPAAGIEQLAKLGASSASRLSLLSENFSIENALERWRLTTSAFAEGGSIFSVRQMLRSLGYSVLSAGLCIFPLVVAYFVGAFSVDVLAKSGLRWDSAVDVSIILLCTYNLVNSSLQKAIHSTESHRYVDDFLSALAKTLREIKESNKSKAGIQFMSSVSATAGLQVRDLWASHTSKRAWAVRGANLVCKNGEILAILGDDESGKTRLLTTICENLIFPPKRCRTTNKVRGFVNVGGVDGSKWDQPMLKRRLGILLSDVRTVADTATLFSGWTMEELLEPVVGLQTVDPAHRLSSSERSSIILALKITGLYSSLLPKLPSKLATVVTANEEDIHPSVLRAGCSVLSPAVWSKVILTKVIAQTIFDNDNAAASMDKVENCLMGSVLILDDPTVLLSEVEEAKMLNELRKTGAATIFSTNKWATGRFADRIVVVKDGAVVESGTHNELIARGPQQSTYAAKWHAMTMQ